MDESQFPVEVTPEMVEYSDLVKRIARKILLIDVDVKFGVWEGNFPAQYINRTLFVNVRVTGRAFFGWSNNPNLMSLTIHELACEYKNTCQSHSQLCAHIGAEMLIIALKEPEFFNVEVK